MFRFMASAMALLKCPGQALPNSREVNAVSVIRAAPLAMLSPMRHMTMMCS